MRAQLPTDQLSEATPDHTHARHAVRVRGVSADVLAENLPQIAHESTHRYKFTCQVNNSNLLIYDVKVHTGTYLPVNNSKLLIYDVKVHTGTNLPVM